MFDIPIDQVIGLLKPDHGASYLQTILLFLILINSRGLKKAIQDLRESLNKLEVSHEVRIGAIEHEIKSFDVRLMRVEQK